MTAFALACVAGETSASAFRELAPGVVRFVSDGGRYEAWQVSEGSPAGVFDTVTRRRTSISMPPGCGLADGPIGYGWPAAAGRFFVACTNGQQFLLTAATGA
jgi:hypothetical protein